MSSLHLLLLSVLWALDTGSRRRQEIAVVYLCFESILNSTIQVPVVVRCCQESNIIDIVSDAIDLSQDLSEKFLAMLIWTAIPVRTNSKYNPARQ